MCARGGQGGKERWEEGEGAGVSEQRQHTPKGWRGQVRLCDGGASDESATRVSCFVGWHRPPIEEHFCDSRNLQVNFSAAMWTQWSRRVHRASYRPWTRTHCQKTSCVT